MREDVVLGCVCPYKIMRRRRPAKPGQESLVCMAVDIASGVASLPLSRCCLRENARFSLSGNCSIGVLRRVDREGSRMHVDLLRSRQIDI